MQLEHAMMDSYTEESTSVEAQLEPNMLFPANDSDDSWVILAGKTCVRGFR
jgi:hypothetical protein